MRVQECDLFTQEQICHWLENITTSCLSHLHPFSPLIFFCFGGFSLRDFEAHLFERTFIEKHVLV